MSLIPESDKSVLYATKNANILVSSIREGFCQGSKGVAQDVAGLVLALPLASYFYPGVNGGWCFH
jgi:hypothetical protein